MLAISRFRVANGMEKEVREAFRNRPRLVEDAPGFLDSQQIFGRHAGDKRGREFQGLADAGQLNAAAQFRMSLHKVVHRLRRRGASDALGDINGKEIGRRDESVHRV